MEKHIFTQAQCEKLASLGLGIPYEKPVIDGKKVYKDYSPIAVLDILPKCIRGTDGRSCHLDISRIWMPEDWKTGTPGYWHWHAAYWMRDQSDWVIGAFGDDFADAVFGLYVEYKTLFTL